MQCSEYYKHYVLITTQTDKTVTSFARNAQYGQMASHEKKKSK